MLGLGKLWRLTVRNGTAVDIAASGLLITGRYVRFDVNGKQEYSGEDSIIMNAAILANNAYLSSGTKDNTADKWLGGDFVVSVVAPAGATGRVDIYYERSVAGTWPDNGKGKLVAQISTPAAATYNLDFSI